MIDTNEISKFLTPELCEDAGIIVIEIGDESSSVKIYAR